MKTQKNLTLTFLLFCLTIFMSFGQQMFTVFEDNVKPSKFLEYEKAVKAFNDACAEHNVDMEWYTASQDDFTYYYVSPIEKYGRAR